MYKVKLNRNNARTDLILDGNLTIRTIAELKKGFQKAISKKKDILIDLTNGKEFDLTFLHLLLSLKKTIKDRDLNVNIKNKLPQPYTDLIYNSGMAEYSWLLSNTELESRGAKK